MSDLPTARGLSSGVASSADPRRQWMHERERGSMTALRFMTWLSLTLGRRVSRWVLPFIALYFVVAVGGARRASGDYLQRVLGRAPGWIDTFRHFHCFASTVHDRVYLLNDRFEAFDIQVRGEQALHAWRERSGRGALLFGAHLGSFEVLRAMTRHGAGFEVVGAMYPENARQINEVLAAINPRVMHEIVPLGRLESILQLHERLEKGTTVGILADRSVGGDQYVRLPFLGEPAPFPVGPFRMAAVLREPVFFMVGLYLGGHRYEVRFEQLSDGLPAGTRTNREAYVRDLMQRYVHTLEQHCHVAPLNWFNFFDFWQR